ncbi:MAG: zincin-like metallopeptidase domain-containing protein [bacterium]|nr:zincin-like metallopeptidase domain-containing protein [bacterium]
MKHTGEKKDVYQEITNKIIAALESSAPAGRLPWQNAEGSTLMPVNAVSKKPYRGVNILTLMVQAIEQGYPSNQWGTYKQWQEKGCQVRKGEKASLVVFWKFFDKEGQDDRQDAGEQEAGKIAGAVMARGYAVFNAAQVEGFQPEEQTPEKGRVERAENFFSSLQTEIRHGGNRAYYAPVHDYIQMPQFSQFYAAEGYYSVLSHEITHWSGAKSRLDRDLSGRFGNESYAAEELIAELGAAFLCAELGLSQEPREDHAQYIVTWLKVLKNDKRAIFTAASKAQQAVDWMREQQEEMKDAA